MHTRIIALLLILSSTIPIASYKQAGAQSRTLAPASSTTIPTPQEVLGFTPGDDRKLASWGQIVAYFEKLAQTSERVKFEALGNTTMGKPFVMATISAPENLAKLEEYKKIQDLLADPRKLGAPKVRDLKAAGFSIFRSSPSSVSTS
jgi:hypothetical protein